jgi:hypothetical protein
VSAQFQASLARRIVFIGRSSILWARLLPHLTKTSPIVAIGHRDIRQFSFASTDEVWIGSYAPDILGNETLFNELAKKSFGRCFYISTATANIAEHTNCYRYPHVKSKSEFIAKQVLGAQIVRIGLIYNDPSELPSGINAATKISDLVDRMILEKEELIVKIDENQYKLVKRSFSSIFEKSAYNIYGKIIDHTGRYPCVLRPIDWLLGVIGWRWYGYLYLSNKKCMSTS